MRGLLRRHLTSGHDPTPLRQGKPGGVLVYLTNMPIDPEEPDLCPMCHQVASIYTAELYGHYCAFLHDPPQLIYWFKPNG